MRRGIAASPLATYSAGLASRNNPSAGLGNRIWVESFNLDAPFAQDTPSVASDFFFDQLPEVAAVAGWRMVRAAAITGGGPTQDFTVPGIGTPAGAIVVVTGATVGDGTAAADKKISIGIKTSGFEGGIAGVSQDAQTVSVSDCTGFLDALVKIVQNGAGGYDAVATSAIITDGIRLTWSTLPPSAFIVDVMLFFGPDIQVDADVVTGIGSGNTSISMGFAPDMLFCIGTTNAFDNNTHATCTLDLFLGTRAGNKTYTYWSQEPDNVSTMEAQLVTDHPTPPAICGPFIHTSLFVFSDATLFNTWDSGGFTINSAGGTPEFIYLAARFGGKQVFSSVLETPSATGDVTYAGSGMTPAYAMTLMSRLSTIPSNSAVARAGAMGISAFNAAGEQFAAGVTNQDNVADSNTASFAAAKAYYLPTDSAAAENTATVVSFGPNEFTLNYTAQLSLLDFVTLLVERDTHLAEVAPVAPHITASASGLEVFRQVGSSSLSLSGAKVLAASGLEVFKGDAAVTLSGAKVLAASGLEVFTGTSALSGPHVSTSASGLEVFRGTSALSGPHPSISASGSEVFTGTSALSLSGAKVLAASGLEVFRGAPDLVGPHPATSAAGLEVFRGASTLVGPHPAISAAGTVTLPGISGTIVLVGPHPQIYGTNLPPIGCEVEMAGSWDGVGVLDGSFDAAVSLDGSYDAERDLKGSNC